MQYFKGHCTQDFKNEFMQENWLAKLLNDLKNK